MKLVSKLLRKDNEYGLIVPEEIVQKMDLKEGEKLVLLSCEIKDS